MSILKEAPSLLLLQSPAGDVLEQEVVLSLPFEVPPSSPDTRDLPLKLTSPPFSEGPTGLGLALSLVKVLGSF